MGLQKRTAKVVGGRVAGGRGSESGECGKDAGKEGMWCQGVTGDWHVVGGGSGRVSGRGDRWQETMTGSGSTGSAWAMV